MVIYREEKFSEISTGRKVGRAAGWVVVAALVISFSLGFLSIGLFFLGY